MERLKPKIIDGEICWKCSGCDEYKPTDQFGPNKKRWNQIDNLCRLCRWRRHRIGLLKVGAKAQGAGK